jgi:AAA15 family ATPase/GTPase
MLSSLHIKNYRNLKELRINSLGRINLITGRNNTGKSTLLEAIAIYASKGDLNLIYQLLEERGENPEQKELNKNSTDNNIKVFSSLFTDRLAGFEKTDTVYIGDFEDDLPGKSISFRFVKYIDETQNDERGNVTRKRVFLPNDKQIEDYKVGFEIKTDNIPYILTLEEDRPFRFGFWKTDNNIQFIRAKNIDKNINGSLFDKIALTEKEQYVVDALKIIEPLTERIAFVEEISRERNAVIKLSDSQRILPLRSMGDGINRILTIILALINANNSFLLIDEFENGLHYTIQEQLWDIIFQLSEKLNTQVFVTTHSEDCISGFEKVLNRRGNPADGKLIRLDSENGIIGQVEFNAKELQVANEQHIEIR